MTSPNTCPICKVAVDLCVCEMGEAQQMQRLIAAARQVLLAHHATQIGATGIMLDTFMTELRDAADAADGMAACGNTPYDEGPFTLSTPADSPLSSSPTYPEGMKEQP